jgi:predicted enzyme related to lactoylglutathione lyase
MHRSQLAGFIIDCEGGDLDAAANFWGQALGYEAKPLSGPDEDDYRQLDTGPDGIHIEVQRVDHPSRVHLDIETDDIEAEVQRLEALGAKRLKQIKTWWVMEAPTGQRFCVVRIQRKDFADTARQW